MAWTVELAPAALKELRKLDRQVARRILSFLRQRLSVIDDPRSIGEALRGDTLGEYWKYRLGDYRIVSRIIDRRILILVLRVGHRSDVHRD